MSQSCNHNCKSCSSNCSDRKESLKEALNEKSSVKKVIAVVSGKGGVGKSSVTSLLSVASQREGYKTAILDADITGPSIPKAFGVSERIKGDSFGMFPAVSRTGIEMMSANFLLQNETDPVISKSPVITGTVKQFWSGVNWKDIDVMFIDMPPGTGDVPITVFQSLPIDGVVIVTTPQELVTMIVEKGINMANKMNVPVLAIVENMSYFECPSCNEKHHIYGESKIEKTADKYGIKNIAKLPIDPTFTKTCDEGDIEFYEENPLQDFIKEILK